MNKRNGQFSLLQVDPILADGGRVNFMPLEVHKSSSVEHQTSPLSQYACYCHSHHGGWCRQTAADIKGTGTIKKQVSVSIKEGTSKI